ncbi:MAG: hypothetical protein ACK56F_28695, partial [bacterium]
RGTHLVASDLSWDLMLFSSHLCLSTIGHRIFGFSSPWPFLPYSLFSDCLPMQGLSGFDLPPSGKVLL